MESDYDKITESHRALMRGLCGFMGDRIRSLVESETQRYCWENILPVAYPFGSGAINIL